MFWLLLTTTTLLFHVEAFGNNECVEKIDNNQNGRGFSLSKCTDAEIAIKWNKEHFLHFDIHKNDQNYLYLNVSINNVCEFNLEGKYDADGKWKYYIDEIEFTCDSNWCFLDIESNGELRMYKYELTACRGLNLHHQIDDQWVWATIRLEANHISYVPDFKVYVTYPNSGEGEEYSPSDSDDNTRD
ncbi:hypothetical protein M3Y94_00010700 [Aphelenchoides besseyi]|nr:hypothetical protein M3Y94_00010700 [Aphelenchoides besseyi]KAI6220716.1 hypothetical protein M3Y95_01025600 [Aphelenchoides besseyi]